VPILSALCDSTTSFLLPSVSPYANCDRFGPVTQGLKISPTGSNPSRIDGICHQTSDRQYRSHALIPGKKHQWEVGLSCRTRSAPSLPEVAKWEQVSGTSDLAVGVANCSYRTTYEPSVLDLAPFSTKIQINLPSMHSRAVEQPHSGREATSSLCLT
jgi:hypothetical protein